VLLPEIPLEFDLENIKYLSYFYIIIYNLLFSDGKDEIQMNSLGGVFSTYL